MSKLKLEAIPDDKPVKITIELPAEIDRDLKTYAALINRQNGQSVSDATRLIVPMLRRFMATDRAFKKLKHQSLQGNVG